jgi:hypothetical protein
LRREAYGWIRWNDVSSCEVVGREKALKSNGFISMSGIAENKLEFLFFLLNSKQNKSGLVRIARAKFFGLVEIERKNENSQENMP